MRYSRQRDLIENIVKNRFDHPTADMVYESAKKTEPNISLGTVYRNLKQLADGGIIDTLETVDKKIHYDGTVKVHSHFICLKCGKIVDVETKSSQDSAFKEMGFEITTEKCVFYGYCNDCK